jgi:hypothetical protein
MSLTEVTANYREVVMQAVTDKYWRWWIGLPAPTWLKEVQRVEKFVEKYNLEQIATESLFSEWIMASETQMLEQPQVSAESRQKIRFPRPRPYPGGIRIPHLHYKGDVYALDERQWQEYTKGILEGFQTKLANSKSVSVEQLVELSEAIDALQ